MATRGDARVPFPSLRARRPGLRGVALASAVVAVLTVVVPAGPAHATTASVDDFVVTSLAASGPGTLHQAILDANGRPGADVVRFSLDGAGPHTLDLDESLPAVSEALVLDATTQHGYDGTPAILLRGAGTGVGLAVGAGPTVVRGFDVAAFEVGVEVTGSDVAVVGNRIVGNRGDGVRVRGAAHRNRIGGPDPSDGNVVGGNGGAGVAVSGPAATELATLVGAAGGALGPELLHLLVAGGNRVEGNHIGADAERDIPGNVGAGVSVEGAASTFVGGTQRGTGNTLAGNGGAAVAVARSASTTIVGNVADGNGGALVSRDAVAAAVPTDVTAARGGDGTLDLSGRVTGPPSTSVRVDVYATESCAAPRRARPVGSAAVALDTEGTGSWRIDGLPSDAAALAVAVTTAAGDTSDLAACAAAPEPVVPAEDDRLLAAERVPPAAASTTVAPSVAPSVAPAAPPVATSPATPPPLARTEPTEAAAVADCTISFDFGAGSTSWAEPTNWTGDRLPTAADVACTPSDRRVVFAGLSATIAGLVADGPVELGSGTLVLNGPATAMDLTLHGATVLGSGDLSIPSGGRFQMNGGELGGTGTVTLDAGSVGVITGAGDKFLGGSLTNRGSLTWDGTGRLFTRTDRGNPSPLLLSEGVLDARPTTTMVLQHFTGPGSARFTSTGTLRVAGQAATAVLHVRGLDVALGGPEASVTGGALELAGGSVAMSAASTAIAGDAVLRVMGSTVSSTGRVHGAGRVEVSAGSFTAAAGSVFEVPSVSVSGGAFSNDSTIALRDLTVAGGFAGGSGQTSVTTSFGWSGGEVSGTGVLVLAAGSVSAITGPDDKFLGGSLTNRGSLVWSGTGRLFGRTDRGNPSPLLANEGAMEARPAGTMSFHHFTGPGSVRWSSTGVLRVVGQTPAAVVQVRDVGVGFGGSEVLVTGAVLELVGGSALLSAAGTEIAAGAVLRVAASAVTSTGRVHGAGRVVVSAGSFTAAAGSVFEVPSVSVTNGIFGTDTAITLRELTLSGGSFGGSGRTTVDQGFTWSGGELFGTGELVLDVLSINAITGTGDKVLGAALTNRGFLAWDGSGRLFGRTDRGNPSPLLLNEGAMEARPTGTLSFGHFSGPGSARWSSTGVVRVVGQTSAAVLQVRDVGVGFGGSEVSVTGAVLELAGGSALLSATGTEIAADSVLRVAASAVTSTGRVHGAGRVVVSAGSFTAAAGSVFEVPSVSVSNGIFGSDTAITLRELSLSGGSFGGSGRTTVDDGFSWSGGELFGTGELVLDTLSLSAITGSGDKVLGAALTNRGFLAWDGTGRLFGRTDRGNPSPLLLNEGAMEARPAGTLSFGHFSGPGSVRWSSTGVLRVVGQTSAAVVQVRDVGVGFGGSEVSVTGAVLELAGGSALLSAAETEIGADAVLRVAASAVSSTGRVHGAGRVVVSAGSFTAAAGSVVEVPSVSVSGGVFANDTTIGLGSLSLSGGSFGGSGGTVVDDSFTWSGGELFGTGELVLDVLSINAITGSGDKVLGATLTNRGFLVWDGAGRLFGRTDRGNASPLFANAGSIEARPAATVSFAHFAGPGSARVLNTETGTFRSVGPGTVDIRGVDVENRGTLAVDAGTVLFQTAPTNLSGTTLTGGVWTIAGGAVLRIAGADVRTNAATVSLLGPGARFVDANGLDAFRILSTNTGTLTIDGVDVATSASVGNAGTLVLGPAGRLTAAGGFSQTADGVLRVSVDGPVPGSTHGQVRASSTAVVGGTLQIVTSATYSPQTTDRIRILEAPGGFGEFATVTGAQLGVRGTWTVDYSSDRGDVDLTITDQNLLRLTVADVAVVEGGDVRVTVTLDAPAPGNVTIFAAVGGDDLADFDISSDAATIPSGETSTTLVLTTVDDGGPEGRVELFTIGLAGDVDGADVVLSDSSAMLQLVDDDSALANRLDDVSAVEGSGVARVEFVLTEAPLPIDVTLSGFTGSDGTTASIDVDYRDIGFDVVLQAGETSAFIDVPLIDDSADEPDETFLVLLVGADLGVAPSTHVVSVPDIESTVTIVDDDEPVVLAGSVSSPAVVEGGSTSVVVTLAAPATAEVTLFGAVQGDDLSDFDQSSDVAVIPAGETSGTLVLDTVDDEVVEERTDFFELRVAASVNGADAVLSEPSGLVRVVDEDAPLQTTVSDVSVSESAGSALVEVTIVEDALPVAWFVNGSASESASGGATAGADFTAVSAQVEVPVGSLSAVFVVPVLDDVADEADESFGLVLSNVQLGAPDGPSVDQTAVVSVVTIVDDDASQVLDGSVADVAIVEGGVARVTVTLAEPASAEVSLLLDVFDELDDLTDDFGGITIAAGQRSGSADLRTTADTTAEARVETFDVVAFGTLGGDNVVLSDPTATLQLVDDDSALANRLDDVSAVEGGGVAHVPFVLTEAPLPVDVTVFGFTGSEGTASADVDYRDIGFEVVLQAGETSVFIDVPLIDDRSDEADETFLVLVVGGDLGAVVPSSHVVSVPDIESTVTIVDDDETVLLAGSISNPAVVEGETALVTVTLDAPAPGNVSLFGAVEGDDLSDFTQSSDLASIRAGETTATILIRTLDEEVAESRTELFVVGVVATVDGADAEITGQSGLLQLVDDDTPLQTESVDVSVDEAAGVARVAVTLTEEPLPIPWFVNGATVEGGPAAPATSGTDFTRTVGPVEAVDALEAVFEIPILDDVVHEGPESFVLFLTDVLLGSLEGRSIEQAAFASIVTIVDDDDPPVLTSTVTDVVVVEGGAAEVTVTLAEPSPSELLLFVEIAGADADFSRSIRDGVIPVGGRSATFTLETQADITEEPRVETFTAVATAFVTQTLQPATLTDDRAEVRVVDDDTPLQTDAADVSVDEAAGVARVEVTLTEPPLPVSWFVNGVAFDTATGGATEGLDFTPGGAQAAAGSTSAVFEVPIIDDIADEPSESFGFLFANVRLGTPDGPSVEQTAIAATVTIVDDDDALPVSVGDVTVVERTGTVDVTVTFAAPTPGPITITAFPQSATAVEGADFPADQLVTAVVATGSTSVSLPIAISDDSAIETDETFTVVLGAALGGQDLPLTDEAATVTILDEDAPVPTFVADAQLLEAAGTAVVPVTFPQPLRETLIVSSVTVAGSAAAGSDFVTLAGRVRLPAGTTGFPVNVSIVDDAVVEATEQLTVTLSAVDASGASVVLTDSAATVTIVDDDRQADASTGAALDAALDRLLGQLPEWAAVFDLDDVDLPALGLPAFELPVVTDDLGTVFDVGPSLGDLANPLDGLTGDVDVILDAIEAAGCTIDFVAGGIGGRTAATGDDVIQIRCARNVPGLSGVAVDGADLFNDDTAGVLEGLSSAVDLSGDGFSATADLSALLVVGVDAAGPYVARQSGASLAVTASGSLSGGSAGDLAGLGTATLTGSASADVTVAVGPSATGGQGDRVRLDDIGVLLGGLVPRATGTATLEVDFALAGAELRWSGGFSATPGTDGATTVDVAPALGGTLPLPGLDDPTTGDPFVLDLDGAFDAGTWTLSATAPRPLVFGGFTLAGLAVDLALSPASLAVGGSGTVTVPLAGVAPIAVSLDLSVIDGVIAARGTISLDGVVIPGADPALVWIDGATLSLSTEGGATIDGDPGGSLVVLPRSLPPAGSPPPDGAVVARDFTASVAIDGTFTASAGRVSADVADGAVELTLTDVVVGIGPGATGVPDDPCGPSSSTLVAAGSATGVVPSLGDLTVTANGLSLCADGRFGVDSIDVDTNDFAETIGLGGILPFEVTDLTVVFPDRTNLADFDTTVVGRFDFAPFSGLPFSPVIGLGGVAVTADSPPEENRFMFSVRVDGGVVTPLDVRDLTFGFDDLTVGTFTLGAALTLGGFVDGEPVNTVGGQLSVVSGFEGVPGGIAVSASGTLTPSPTGGTLAVTGDISVSATIGRAPAIEVEDLALRYGLVVTLDDGDITFTPTFEGLDVGRLTVPVGDLVTFTATDATFDFDPGPDGHFAEFNGGLTVGFTSGELDGWRGTVAGFALDRELRPVPLEGFAVDLTIPEGFGLGLPDFLPLRLDDIGITFPSATPGQPLDLLDFAVRVSGGLNIVRGDNGDTLFPVEATVEGLELDLGELVAGRVPFTNLDGLSFGVAPFEVAGLTIGGGVELGSVRTPDRTVFFVRITGTFEVAGFGAGVDLVISDLGPVVAEVSAPLGIPLGPSGIILTGVSGGVLFGAEPLVPPNPDDPGALLTMPLFDQLGDFEINGDTIAEFVTAAAARNVPTWGTTATFNLAGHFTHLAAPVVEGDVVLGATFGDGTADLLAKGEVEVYGLPFGEIGIRIDLGDPLNPAFQFAVAAPPPGSPLAFLLPARVDLAAVLDTTGLAQGTVVGLQALVEGLVSGSLGVGGDLLDTMVVRLAASLEADRLARLGDGAVRPLTRAVLDNDGDGLVEAGEQRPIDDDLLLARLAAVFGGDVAGALDVAQAFLVEVSAAGVDPDVLAADGAAALDTLVAVFRDAVRDGAEAFLATANPVLTMTGAMQPTVLGIPIGGATDSVALRVTTNSVDLRFTTSLSDMLIRTLNIGSGGLATIFTPVLDIAMTDEVTVIAEFPVAGAFAGLIGGGDFPDMDPGDSWGVSIEGVVGLFGLKLGELSGLLVPPGNRGFVDAHSQKLFVPGAVFDPADPSRPMPLFTEAQYENLVAAGGLVLTGNTRAPQLLVDPIELFADPALAPPSDPLQIPDWLSDLGTTLSREVATGLVQLYLPPPTDLDRAHLVGEWDARILSVAIGGGSFALTEDGLSLRGRLPFGGIDARFDILPPLTSGPAANLPRVGAELTLTTDAVNRALDDLGVPSTLRLPAGAAGSGSAAFRAFTPGFDLAAVHPDGSPDDVRRLGGIEAEADLRIAGIVDAATFRFAFGRTGDFTARAHVEDLTIGPIAASSADLTVVKTGSSFTAGVHGTGTLFGASVTVDGDLDARGFGTLVVTVVGSPANLGGFTIAAGFTLVLDAAGVTLSFAGRLGLPAWLAAATGTATVEASGRFGNDGTVDLRLAVAGLPVEPTRTIVLETKPAPPGGTAPPLLRLRRAGAAAPIEVAVDARLSIARSGLPLLDVSGSFSTVGVAALTVSFPVGGLVIGGFTLAGGATLHYDGRTTPATFNIAVDARMTITGVLTNARVTGAIDVNGLRFLDVSIAGLDATSLRLGLPGVTLSSLNLDITRTGSAAPFGYRMDVGATGNVVGVVTGARVTGFLDSAGRGSLTLGATTVNLLGLASITEAAFTIARDATSVTVGGSGKLTYLGRVLTVGARATLTSAGPSGRLTLTAPAASPLSFSGLDLSGTFVLDLQPSPLLVRVEVIGGQVTVPGTTNVVTVNGFLGSDGLGTLSVVIGDGTGSVRFGSGPFSVGGTFTLSRLVEGGVTVGRFSATNATFAWSGVGSFVVSSFVITTTGVVTAAIPAKTFALPLGGSLEVGASTFRLDAGGLDARLDAGTLKLLVPGIADDPLGIPDDRFTVPGFTVRTVDFTRVLLDGTRSFGGIGLRGRIVLAKSGATFRLDVGSTTVAPVGPPAVVVGPISVAVPTFSIATNGTFAVDATDPLFGLPGLGIRADRVRFLKDGPLLSDLELELTAPRMLLPIGQAVPLGSTIRIAADASFSRRIDDVGVDLGSVFSVEPADYQLSLAAGVLSFSLIDVPFSSANTPIVSALAGTTDMEITSLTARSDGFFDADLVGRLSLFGIPLARNDFDVNLSAGVLTVNMNGPAALDLGFLEASVDGSFDSTGRFRFDGSTSLVLPDPANDGISGNGSDPVGCAAIAGIEMTTAVSVSSATGISGAVSIRVCAFGASVTTSAAMDSRGVVTGTAVLRAGGVTVFSGAFQFITGTGRLRFFNADGSTLATFDLLPVDLSSTEARDTDRPDFDPDPPPNQSFGVDVPVGGTARVDYVVPDIDDPPNDADGSDSVLVCAPASGTRFPVGATAVSCTATDRAGNSKTRGFTVTVTDITPLTVGSTLFAGSTLQVTGSGFDPAITAIVELHSLPVRLGEVVPDELGNVIFDATIPPDTEPGEHAILIIGRSENGDLHVVQHAITVAARSTGGGGGTGSGGGSGTGGSPIPTGSTGGGSAGGGALGGGGPVVRPAPAAPTPPLAATGVDIVGLVAFGLALGAAGLLAEVAPRHGRRRRRRGLHAAPGRRLWLPPRHHGRHAARGRR